jgi:hypothetical protein
MAREVRAQPIPEPEPARDRYRVPVRLSRQDHELLDELVEKTEHSRNQTMIYALRHFYWTVLRKREGAYVFLPPPLAPEEREEGIEAPRPRLVRPPEGRPAGEVGQ